MKHYRYYIEAAGGVYTGTVSARTQTSAENKVREWFRKEHPSESMWVWFVTEE